MLVCKPEKFLTSKLADNVGRQLLASKKNPNSLLLPPNVFYGVQIMKCPQCEREFTPIIKYCTHQKFCSRRCREIYNRKRIAEKKEVDRLSRELAAKALDDWIREAAECNLDYGTYRALRQMGKTYEELKATAGERRLQAHNSISRQHFLSI